MVRTYGRARATGEGHEITPVTDKLNPLPGLPLNTCQRIGCEPETTCSGALVNGTFSNRVISARVPITGGVPGVVVVVAGVDAVVVVTTVVVVVVAVVVLAAVLDEALLEVVVDTVVVVVVVTVVVVVVVVVTVVVVVVGF